MSAPLDGVSAGLPPVDRAREPEWVRRGSPATQRAYTSALAFEQALVEQLAQSLAQTGGLEAEGAQEDEGSEAGSPRASAGEGELSSLVPQALAGGVMRAGGLGLAAQLTRELEGLASADAPRGSGGTSAP